ncbi:MAG: DUF5060 domain-containing protein [Armatimonadota bacterium]
MLNIIALAAAASVSAIPTVGRWTLFELVIHSEPVQGNPYDPSQNDVMVVFRTPSGRQIVVPAFYDGETTWRVRFAPTELGFYQYSTRANGQTRLVGAGPSGAFRAVPSNSPGFVRISRRWPTRFAFDSGKPFFPVGHNVAWPSRSQAGYTDYDSFFPAMGRAGENWARVWMCAWGGLNIEWTPGQLGSYNLKAAQYLDRVIRLAEQHGIYVQLVIQHHGQFSTRVNPNWSENPYNAALGGFLQNPGDFFTYPRAKQLFCQRMRYIIARWGYSTHIMAWELFNEVQFTDHRGWDDVSAWHKEMAAYIRANDPYKHLITTSSPASSSPVWESMDYLQSHSYQAEPLAAAEPDVPPPHVRKPFFVGEWGFSNGSAPRLNPKEFLRQGLWGGLMAGASAAPMFWDWELVHRLGLYPTIGAVRRFAELSGIASNGDLKPARAVCTSDDLGPVHLLPTLGWEPQRQTEFVVPKSQAGPMAGFPSFIHGRYHPDMMPKPPQLVLDLSQATTLTVEISRWARAGAVPTVMVDGKEAGQLELPPADRDTSQRRELKVDLPAGRHRVTIGNSGDDWYVLSRVTIDRYAARLQARALASSNAAVVWAYNADPTRGPATAIIHIRGLAPGRYRVWRYSTTTGLGTIIGTTIAGAAGLRIVARSVESDVAYSAKQLTTSVRRSRRR